MFVFLRAKFWAKWAILGDSTQQVDSRKPIMLSAGGGNRLVGHGRRRPVGRSRRRSLKPEPARSLRNPEF